MDRFRGTLQGTQRPAEPVPIGERSLRPGGTGVNEYVVILLDASNSMAEQDYQPTRLEAAKSEVVEFVDVRRATALGDRVAVVSFNKAARVVCPFGADVEASLQAVHLGDDTSISAALETGMRLLWTARRDSPTARLRMVLLSDGGHRYGPDPRGLLEEIRNSRVVVDTMLIGTPHPKGREYFDDDLLIEIAEATGGTFTRVLNNAQLHEGLRRLALPPDARGSD